MFFFNWVKDGYKTGLAIHAAVGPDVAQLGRRASAGCIRLSPDNARAFWFSLIRTHYRGLAPQFAMDRRTGTMSNDGILLHSPAGQFLADGAGIQSPRLHRELWRQRQRRRGAVLAPHSSQNTTVIPGEPRGSAAR